MDGDLYPRFSPQEFARRYAVARSMMAHEGLEGLDALVVYGNSGVSRHNHADVHYLSGFLGNRNNYVVLPAQGDPVLFAQSYNHVPNAREVSAIETRWGGTNSATSVARHVSEVTGRASILGYVGEVPVQDYLTWQRELAGWQLRDVTGPFRRLRLQKSAEEIEWLRRGAALTDTALQNLIDRVRPGMREYQLGALIEEAALSHGGLPHLYYVSSGPQDKSSACVPRQNLSHRVVERGDVINTEISVSYWGYSGQTHRPPLVQAEPNELYRRLWETALEAYTRCCALRRPGATLEEILDAADVIHARGFTPGCRWGTSCASRSAGTSAFTRFRCSTS
ncbi:MAG: aminopeptidase P family protein [Deltaproteobacteria bacterium]|nr:aminopeptidase P family protein [Deltaproteobacteria bacterium]